MSISRIAVITGLELRQRLRSVAWYVMLGVFAVLLIGVTILSFAAWGYTDADEDTRGTGIYSTIIYFVLLLVCLVSPAFSGNAINGDRENATLAAVQVTRAKTGEIVLGKFFAAWITALAFLVVAVPFILISTFAGGIRLDVLFTSLAVLIVETGLFAAIGVALSGLMARGLFSVVTSYLVVAALCVGTLIAFGLGTMVSTTEQVNYSRYTDENNQCGDWESYTYQVPRTDRMWGVLAVNPFVVLADATPAHFTKDGYPADLFSTIGSGMRYAQIPPELETRWDGCASTYPSDDSKTPEEIYQETVPSWFVGLAFHLVLGVGLLVWATSRTHTPARRLPPGTRIA